MNNLGNQSTQFRFYVDDDCVNSKQAFVIFMTLTCLLIGITGCGGRPKSGASGSSAGVKRALEANANFIKSALDYTISIERYEEKGFKKSMVEDLNNWSRQISQDGNWKADPMVDSLSEKFAKTSAVKSIPDMTFRESDADFLQEAVWAKVIAERVALNHGKGCFHYLIGAACHGLEKKDIVALRSSQDPLFSALKSLHPELSDQHCEDLNRALLAFDWVVRNIQLDTMPVEYEGDAELVKAKDYVDVPTGDAPTDGVEGPGYTKTPAQVLISGKGDTWQKSRLFVLLCRQMGIDSVLLNVVDRNDAAKRVPWVVGVLIGEQIFLFDMEMGIPFPAPDFRRIATYDSVLKDRSAITQLRYKLSESNDADPDYRIKPAQLDKVVVWLDASAESLSRRMALLQPKLTGDFKIAISTSPTQIADRLSKWKFHGVELCPLPFQHSLYQLAFDSAVERRKEKALIKNYLETEYFKIKIPIKKVVRKAQIDEQAQSVKTGTRVETPTVTVYLLSEARHRFLLGVFEPDMQRDVNSLGARKLREDLDLGRDTEDAAQMFVNLTLDDNRIDEILSDDAWLAMLGLSADSNTTMSDQELEQYKSIIEASMRLIRTDSSIWLAITNFETGDFGNAMNWINQIKRFDVDSKWQPLTEYNLARTQEALLEFDESIRVLRSSKSAQRFGNIIRARLIQRWSQGDESATQPD